MEILLIIGGIWLFVVIVRAFKEKRSDQQNTNTYTPTSTPTSTPTEKNDQTFRPSSRNRSDSNISFKTTASSSSGTNSNISFKTTTSSSSNTNSVPATADFAGLHDAFTGAPLDKSLGLHQCQSCKIYYHTESLKVLREATDSQCVACQSTNIIAVVTGGKATGGRDYAPNVVTLQNYRQYAGSVVTFEGFVHKVNESRRGNDFAVMFENKSWVRGFKLVFFRDGVRNVGGKPYITTLRGKTIKVRGLVVNHPKFGYEIIVSEKSMILDVK